MLTLASLVLRGCARSPAVAPSGAPVTPVPPPRPTARTIAFQAAHVLIPYHDPWHTFELGRPQTWVTLDARTTPSLAPAFGDGMRFFEPITASDPDAGSSGKLWIEVLPIRPGDTPRQALLAPFAAADYPASLLKRMTRAPASLGGVQRYRLVTLASRTQVTLLLIPWRRHYYRLTIFGAASPAEVHLALRTWRWIGR